MERRQLSTFWDRITRDDINLNFEDLYNSYKDIVGGISEEAFAKVIDAAMLKRKEPVETYEDLPNGDEIGTARMSRDSGKIYRFNGSNWDEIEDIDPTAINEVDSRLSQAIGHTQRSLNDVRESIPVVKASQLGAVGNSDIDNTDIFKELEEGSKDSVIDLEGKVFNVSREFSGNYYTNGSFNVSGTVKKAPFSLAKSDEVNVFLGLGAGSKNKLNAEYLSSEGGYSNTGVGKDALSNNSAGWRNTAIGFESMRDNVIGQNNVAIGDSALERNIGEKVDDGLNKGSRNTALGSYALRYNVSGIGNVGVGRNAAHSNETGDYNTAIGTNAYSGSVEEGGQQDRKGASFNTAVGYNSLFNTDADYNIGLGYRPLYANVSGKYNISIGNNSNISSKGSSRNVTLGDSSLRDLVAGNDNVAFGVEALRNLTTGESNLAFGDLSLGFNVQGNPLTKVNHSIGIGKQSRVSGDQQLQLGTSGISTYSYGPVQNRSDERDKADIRDTQLGIDFINKLRPVDYKWDYREDYNVINKDGTVTFLEQDGSKKRERYHHGLIAQEVEAVLGEMGVDFGGFQDHKIKGGDDVYSIGYSELIAPLIKSVQELSRKCDRLEKQVNDINC